MHTHMKGREFFCPKWASHTATQLFSGNVQVKSHLFTCTTALMEEYIPIVSVVGETKNLMF